MSIGMSAFYGTALYNNQRDADVIYVDRWIVECDSSITSVEIKEGTRGIADYAFYNCIRLKSIDIPNSVISIGDHAFGWCGLTSIVLPDSVTSILGGAFFNCWSLVSITIENPQCEIYDSFDTLYLMDIVGIRSTGIIYGHDNSTAQAYADKYNIKFAVIGTEYVGILGDANGDGKLLASDAAFIAKILAQSGIAGKTVTIEDYPNADFNSDGKVTAADAAAIAKYLAEKALQK